MIPSEYKRSLTEGVEGLYLKLEQLIVDAMARALADGDIDSPAMVAMDAARLQREAQALIADAAPEVVAELEGAALANFILNSEVLDG